MAATFTPTPRTTVRRLAKRGSFDREQAYRILDEALVCHVGFVVDGYPAVIPTVYGRKGDVLYIHGSVASRMLRTLEAGVEACVTVTLLDALVLARSAFHHSVNYRSVVVFGVARAVTDAAEKLEALRVVTNHVAPKRWEDVREPTDAELTATSVLALPLEECSVKTRTGHPIDDEEDHALPVWAGLVPVRTVFGPPVADPLLRAGINPADAVVNYQR
jgi:nitroimidazol reductase NimA-like FMN-containing flavoprotein (pyridoxamine 5'-phosphate oxidase superfamily)